MALQSQSQTGYALIVPLGVGITQVSAGQPTTSWSSQNVTTDWTASGLQTGAGAEAEQ